MLCGLPTVQQAAIAWKLCTLLQRRSQEQGSPVRRDRQIAPCGPRDLENPLTQSGPRSRGVEQGLPCYIELGPPPRRCGAPKSLLCERPQLRRQEDHSRLRSASGPSPSGRQCRMHSSRGIGRIARHRAFHTAELVEHGKHPVEADWQFTTSDARIKLKRLYPRSQGRISSLPPLNAIVGVAKTPIVHSIRRMAPLR
jgi:hypothetical protein